MGRSAKLVRTGTFVKQKRQEAGKEWRKSQWKEAREKEKLEKRTQESEAVLPSTASGDASIEPSEGKKAGARVSFAKDVDMGADAENKPAKFTRSKKKVLGKPQ